MALISLPIGNVLVPWIGPATTLSTQTWFTNTNLKAVYKVSANRQSYISNKPGSLFPAFAQVTPTPNGQVPDAYIFVVKTSFSLDSTLIGQPVLTTNFPEPDIFSIDGTSPLAGETVYAVAEQIVLTVKSVITATFTTGTGTVQVSFDNGTSWTTVGSTPVTVYAGQGFQVQVLHAAGAAFFAMLTANAA